MKFRQLLYLIEAGGLYKIGISNNINNRIRELQTGCAHDVNCIAYYLTEKPAIQVERALHKLFDKYRLRGEWFDFEGRFTQEAFDTLCTKYGMTRLSVNEDGTFQQIEAEVKEKKKTKIRKFGDLPPSAQPQTTYSEREIEYWRRRYGIKTKGS